MDAEKVIVPRGKFQTFVDAVKSLQDSAEEIAAVPEVDSIPEMRLDYELVKAVVSLGLEFIDKTKPYGTELFNGLCRVTVTPAYEAVCLRRNPATGQIEVLLAQRSANDSVYPGHWHCPGTCAQANENEAGDFSRLGTKEFSAPITRRRLVDQVDAPDVPRGRHISLVFLCEVPEASQGTWFPVNQLPEPMVPIHRDTIIPRAVAQFTEERMLKLLCELWDLSKGHKGRAETDAWSDVMTRAVNAVLGH